MKNIKKKIHFVAALVLCSMVLVPAMTGCSHQSATTTPTSEEQKAFKGGPMPPEAQKAMAAALQKAGQKASQSPTKQ